MSIELPDQPSHAVNLVADPGGRYLYFLLLPGQWESEPEPDHTEGLWRADTHTGALAHVLPSLPVEQDCCPLHPIAVSPDGRALLMKASTFFNLLDLESGERFWLDLPGESTILDWLPPDSP